MSYSSITLRADLKDRLAVLKGTRSWDEFMGDVADNYPVEAAIAEMEHRLSELRRREIKAVPWGAVKAKAARRRK